MSDWLLSMPPKTTPDNRYVILWPPTVWQSADGSKTFAGSGGTHIEVPPGTTREDVLGLFCWGAEARKYWDPNYSDDPPKTIEVKGSKGKTYNVTKTGPSWKCECRGFQFRQDCKHIQNLKIALEG